MAHPNMKLDKQVVQRRLDVLEAAGITFVTNCTVGKDIMAQALRGAVTPSCWRRRDEAARSADSGRELNGIHFAMISTASQHEEFARFGIGGRQVYQCVISNVIVIGGGDTGTDCVG